MVNETETLDRVFSALSDATRRAMLQRLKAGEATVGELSRPFDMSPPAITKHLNVLENAGLITRQRVGRTKICRMVPDATDAAQAWIEQQTTYWEESLDRLDRMLTEEEAPSDG